MKLFFCVTFFILTNYCFSQYNDTLYFKSGNVKSCTILKYDSQYVHYEYRGQKGKLINNRISHSSLRSFVIYNEFNEQIYNSKSAKKED